MMHSRTLARSQRHAAVLTLSLALLALFACIASTSAQSNDPETSPFCFDCGRQANLFPGWRFDDSVPATYTQVGYEQCQRQACRDATSPNLSFSFWYSSSRDCRMSSTAVGVDTANIHYEPTAVVTIQEPLNGLEKLNTLLGTVYNGGDDYLGLYGLAFEDCERFCYLDQKCQVFSWSISTGNCWLKSLQNFPYSDPSIGFAASTSYNSAFRIAANSSNTETLMFRTIDVVDFNLGDAFLATINSCEEWCKRNPSCKSFVWQKTGQKGNCQLKSGFSSPSANSDSNVWVGLRPNKVDNTPMVVNLYYGITTNSTQDEYATLPATGGNDCQSFCCYDPLCQAFSLDIDTQTCHLYSSFTAFVADSNKLSGRK